MPRATAPMRFRCSSSTAKRRAPSPVSAICRRRSPDSTDRRPVSAPGRMDPEAPAELADLLEQQFGGGLRGFAVLLHALARQFRRGNAGAEVRQAAMICLGPVDEFPHAADLDAGKAEVHHLGRAADMLLLVPGA